MKRALKITKILFLTMVIVFLAGCDPHMDFAVVPTKATINNTSALHDDLISIPPPQEKIVVAVYKFRDQTGQYKTSQTSTTFSTAVTQGATSMLIKALEDSGWFIPIEREGLPNLLNERKIIRSSRLQYQAESGQAMPALPPLLYAGVLLEGGVIAYDTNYITGGAGLRYFGVGGSGQIRKDRVTIYLRLVSVKNGQVLKTVSTTKSILSKEVDFGVYRYVSIKKLLEAEAGFSTNEPPSMCVLEAVEKAVYDLIIEGIKDGVWSLKDPQEINNPIIQSYFEEKEMTENLLALDSRGNIVRLKEKNAKAESVSAHIQNVVGEIETDITDDTDTQVVEQFRPATIQQAQTESVSAHLQNVVGEIETNVTDETDTQAVEQFQPANKEQTEAGDEQGTESNESAQQSGQDVVDESADVETEPLAIEDDDQSKPVLAFLQDVFGSDGSVVIDGDGLELDDSGIEEDVE